MPTAAAKEVNEMQKLQRLFAEFPRREEGQTMAEYGVVLAVITIAALSAPIEDGAIAAPQEVVFRQLDK